ncbi:putative RNA-binding protein associated with RNAse of E/G family [Crossiella equi]|uniref:RNA-binding protein associated with RNAse of E/G family n=2 Tax=Crossiella equi TaxID=130796 RepID=A0ABS5AMX9_9PSEU|nr:DUF402 domain-containing protein [Crossiella equi]MBP2477930.1 putative RNA-binding protein associated with RNAse of E/G family [Crossiella equi]
MMSAAAANHRIHPPKVELFDVPGMTNTDPKGFVRQVDEYRVESFGLYLARAVPGHPKFTYLRSWLLPEAGLRVSKWTFRPELGPCHYLYLDVVDVERGPGVWRTTDHYLDLVVHPGERLEVLDTDELLAAFAEGLINTPTAERALRTVHHSVEGITRYGYIVEKWLESTGISLTWRTE